MNDASSDTFGRLRLAPLRALSVLVLTLCVLIGGLVWLLGAPALLRAQASAPVQAAEVSAATYSKLVIDGPAGSGNFGENVLVLANGNYLIGDDGWSDGVTSGLGAVYLYDGETHAQIARLTGSSANDSVGRALYALSNGDYVVVSISWDYEGINSAGAVTFCDGETGCNGVVSDANSLVGSSENDWVGSSGVLELPNGDLVIRSGNWTNDGEEDAGAVTWCSGTSGCIGEIKPTNSLVGESADDDVGNTAIAVLENGDYVVAAPNWDFVTNGKINSGAVRRCPAIGGCIGTFTASNSLVGMLDNDQVGKNGVVALVGGGYVVASMEWDGTRGAATYCADAGCIGTITVANSLMGGAAGNYIGYGGVTPLVDGGYVIDSPVWDVTPPISTEGLVTYCPANNPCTGVAIAADGLIGANVEDFVGLGGSYALPNGGYVVLSQNWMNGVKVQSGAVTYCPPTTGCVNMVVSNGNSLVGNETDDYVGSGGIKILESGAFLVNSPSWDRATLTDTGAVTRCNDSSGCPVGNVNQGNSLVGSSAGERIGVVTPLEGGGYVVGAPYFDGAGSDVGTAMRCSGAGGCTGVITSTDNPLGTTNSDRIGFSVVALANGHYVVVGHSWDSPTVADVGAAIWCDRDLPCNAPISESSALVGVRPGDAVGQIVPLPNGNYIVLAEVLDGDGVENVGALMLGDGRVGSIGEVTQERAVVGSVEGGGYELDYAWHDRGQYLIVGLPLENRVVIYAMQFPLSVPFVGGGSGVVSSQAGPLDCSASGCAGNFNGTSNVTLTVAANTGSVFQGWGGECSAVAIGDPCVATMDRAREISATFTLITHTLTTALAGEGDGKISAPGINCGGDCSEVYSHGSIVTPTAEADANSVFVAWAGACTGPGVCSITMDGDKSVTATFAIKQLEVTLPGYVEGGSITVQVITNQGSAAGNDAVNATYPYGTQLRFTAVPDSGYTFGGWTGALQGQPSSTDVTLVDALNVGAVFNQIGATPQPTPTTPAPGGDVEVYLPVIGR